MSEYKIVFNYVIAKYYVVFYNKYTKQWSPVSTLSFETLSECKQYLDNATVNYRPR
jgi:hypothetical protein